MTLRLLRRLLLGDERVLARRGDRQRWTPSLELLQQFERDFALGSGEDSVLLGRLMDPRARRRSVWLDRFRLREMHLLATGATGAGKTTMAVGLTHALLRLGGFSLLNLDPKGDTSAAFEAIALEEDQADIQGEFRFIRPFDPEVIPPLRLTARERDISPEVTGAGLVTALEEALGADMGTRMRAILTPLATLAVERELPLSVLVTWLADPKTFAAMARQSENERIRAYAGQLPRESRESISALRSRLEAMLLAPAVRRALEARTFLPLEEWIERYHLNFDFSRPPAGQEAAVRLLCAPLVGRITRALLNRSPQPSSPHVWLMVDELQEVLGRFEGLAFSRLVSLARSRGVSCALLHQERSQLPRDLQAALRTNAGMEFVFRPSHRDATTYAHAVPVSERESRPETERARQVRRLARLRRREFLFVAKDSPAGGQFLKAPKIVLPSLGRVRIPSWGDARETTPGSSALRPSQVRLTETSVEFDDAASASPVDDGPFPSLG